MNEVVVIVNDDQWQLFGKFGFFEEVFYFFWVVESVVVVDVFYFVVLVNFGGRFDVFEVDIGVLGEVDNVVEVVKEIFVSVVFFEEVN